MSCPVQPRVKTQHHQFNICLCFVIVCGSHGRGIWSGNVSCRNHDHEIWSGNVSCHNLLNESGNAGGHNLERKRTQILHSITSNSHCSTKGPNITPQTRYHSLSLTIRQTSVIVSVPAIVIIPPITIFTVVILFVCDVCVGVGMCVWVWGGEGKQNISKSRQSTRPFTLHISLISCPDPPSHEEMGLVTIERFLGWAE